MAGRPRNRMSPEQRAKQFMPFAALRGLPEALERKEQEMESQMEEAGEEDTELSKNFNLSEKNINFVDVCNLYKKRK